MPVADRELRSALGDALGRPVSAIARRPNDYCSSFAIEDLEVTLDGGEALRLVFKDTSASSFAREADAAKPAELRDPAREIEAYLRVLGPAGVEVAACYGALADPEGGRHWLFLEAVDGFPLWQTDDPVTWDSAARWLARLHGLSAPTGHRHLLRYDAGYLRRWIHRAVDFAPAGSLDAVAAGWERVIARLAAWPLTLIHGEFYPSNVLVRRGGAGTSIVPVDWEMAGVGPGLLDLAALTSGGWSEEERERLALAYRDALPSLMRPPAHELLDALDHFRLYVAVQWLGWSRAWSPPVEHAHDWLADARLLGERLGLGR